MSLLSIFIRAVQAAVVGVALAAGLCGAASAQNPVEKLVAPGELSRLHEESDATCKSCHSSFNKSAQNSLCLECHKDVGSDLAKKTGLHGRMPNIAGAQCKNCHTEHKGPAFDIVAFDRTTFDHGLTDYPLAGGHSGVECASCHKEKKKYREAPVDCFSCHGGKDPHKGGVGRDCQSCHNVGDWKKVKFDHSKTAFPLLGAHKTAQCASCHVDGKFKGVKTDCAACHMEDDAHKGAFGPACGDCHIEADWKTQNFNHAAKTGFALLGGHAAIPCAGCHTTSLTVPKLSRNCFSCHREDDSHKGRNGPDCASCHSESAWKNVRFDHSRTKFPLRGAHAKATCAACHVEPVTKSLPGTACIDCHKADDPHKGSQGERCASCHNETSWKEKVRFDHDLYSFPLLGKHKAAVCADCHQTREYKSAPSDCFSCHQEDDAHSGTLGVDCAQCHNPASWSFWAFDHDAQTKFPLTGAHEGLKCASCHRGDTGKKVERSSSCISCHRSEDKHRGQYGPACDRCHTTSSFKDVRMP